MRMPGRLQAAIEVLSEMLDRHRPASEALRDWGKAHRFAPGADLKWYYPTSIWFKAWFYAVMENPELYADSAGAIFCRQHAELKPVAVTLLEYQEGAIGPDDHLSGKHPLDEEFVTVNTVKRVPCPEPRP